MLNESRIIHIDVDYLTSHMPISSAGAPSTMLACSESRRCALKSGSYEKVKMHGDKDVYICWDRDIILMDTDIKAFSVRANTAPRFSAEGKSIANCTTTPLQTINRKCRFLAARYRSQLSFLTCTDRDASQCMPALEKAYYNWDTGTNELGGRHGYNLVFRNHQDPNLGATTTTDVHDTIQPWTSFDRGYSYVKVFVVAEALEDNTMILTSKEGFDPHVAAGLHFR